MPLSQLFAMLGIEGTYIKYNRVSPTSSDQAPTFLFDESLDRSVRLFFLLCFSDRAPQLAEIVRKLLHMCSAYVTIQRVVEDFAKHESGLVAHAFGAALRVFMKVRL